MHLIVEDTHSLDEAEVARDLGQSAGDIVFLSFSDSDLAAFASAYSRITGPAPALRLANLNRLKHPFSVDLYVESVISLARIVVIRLLGGLDYWRYGVEEIASVARARGVALAIVPGDYAADARLDVASTLDIAHLRRIWGWFQAGGPENMASFVAFITQQASGTCGEPPTWREPVAVGATGSFNPACRGEPRGIFAGGDRPLALVLLYRSIVAAADTAPFPVLADALQARGLNVATRFVTSLKDPDVVDELGRWIDTARPDVIVNTTAFSARREDGGTVLDRAECVVLQAMLATSSRESWQANRRGLSATDLAMNVVLPELDGRVITTAISFKTASAPEPALEFTRLEHRPEADRIAHVANLAANWVRLRTTPAHKRRVALVLSNYPAKAGRTGYAVGLDTSASVVSILAALRSAGYTVGDVPGDVIAALEGRVGAHHAAPRLSLADYRLLFATLPPALRAAMIAAHGEPGVDFTFPVIQSGHLIIALQPDRGSAASRKSDAHDLTKPPNHAYAAFYLWLRHMVGIDALIHLGTHGTLEWLPGKAVALDAASAPEAILGATPVLYPFIVNNPGEAAQAKRRISAVIVGHLTPPLIEAGLSEEAREIEALLDEYSAAQSLDPARARRLSAAILEKARGLGFAEELGLSAIDDPAEALQKLDAGLCDIKEMRIGDGLHTFGVAPSGARLAEMAGFLSQLSGVATETIEALLRASAARELEGLLAGLDGRFVAAGPAGAPSRGRLDVLPTGRNLSSIDPRAVPTSTAWEIGRRAAEDLMTRHAQDHGDWPKRLVVDLWASSSMRTGGDQLAEALALIGVKPEWEPATGRVTGFRVLAEANLPFPRVDVTLRLSGLFRDVFPGAITLFDEAIAAVAALDEPEDVNPLAASRRANGASARIFSSTPGTYGAGGLATGLAVDGDISRDTLGAAYLAASSHAFAGGTDAPSQEFATRVGEADGYVHTRDLAEIDVLSGDAYVDHVGGFAAAAHGLGNAAAIYIQDATNPAAPKTRTLREDIARTIRARAANPRWIAGQMRHGHRGAAEIAEVVEAVYGFAVTSDAVTSQQFDLLYNATLGSDAVRAFLVETNPLAAGAIARAFQRAVARGLWASRRNSTADILADMLVADLLVADMLVVDMGATP